MGLSWGRWERRRSWNRQIETVYAKVCAWSDVTPLRLYLSRDAAVQRRHWLHYLVHELVVFEQLCIVRKRVFNAAYGDSKKDFVQTKTCRLMNTCSCCCCGRCYSTGIAAAAATEATAAAATAAAVAAVVAAAAAAAAAVAVAAASAESTSL